MGKSVFLQHLSATIALRAKRYPAVNHFHCSLSRIRQQVCVGNRRLQNRNRDFSKSNTIFPSQYEVHVKLLSLSGILPVAIQIVPVQTC